MEKTPTVAVNSCSFYGEGTYGVMKCNPTWSSDGCSMVTGIMVQSSDISPMMIGNSGEYYVDFDLTLSCEGSVPQSSGGSGGGAM